MWIVVSEWNDYEMDIKEFDDEESAMAFYDSWKGETTATMYLAEVKEKFDGRQED